MSSREEEMMRLSVYSAFIVGSILLSAIAALGDSNNEACFSCHDRGQFQNTVIHAPVNSGACVQCHNPHVSRYKGLLKKDKGKLCFSCHEAEATSFYEGIVHEPIYQFDCISCHAPHASSRKGLVRSDLQNSCFNCHETLPTEYRYTHPPYLDGDCTACHNPHNASRPMLLPADADSLCRSCHEDSDLKAPHAGFPGSLRDCLSCHSPHGSDRKFLIRNILHEPYAEEGCDTCHANGTGRLSITTCKECHPDVLEQMQSTHGHLSQRGSNACVNCHSPHAGDEKRLLRAREKQVCAQCHRPSIEKYKNSKYRHNSIDNCTDCHYPHGGNDMALLKGNGLEVCAICHEDQGRFTHPVGPDVPDPRTGRMMTCITCHNPMGTEYKNNTILDGDRKLCNQCHTEY